MLFQTFEFLCLLLVVVVAIAAIPRARTQHWLLLVASYVFYGWWDVRFLLLIVLSTVIDYAAARGIRGERLDHRQRLFISGLLLAATSGFLVPDWPALQGADATGVSSIGELLVPSWTGAGGAIGISAAFAILGPLFYGQFFRLGESARRKAFLTLSVIANLGVLAFFKYFDFAAENLVGIASALGVEMSSPALAVALPVGISFYTFQTMSYTIDVYRGKLEPERSFLRLALYVAYFPQLVAGPILRPQQFLPSLAEAWRLRPDRVKSGLNLAFVGMAKKVLIADNVAPTVDATFSGASDASSLLVMLGTALFAVQIYCDFSGYTDIARGISRMFGVEIPLNFDRPYFSTSIIDFWRRWHISLSSWLRDYLYIPLGGSRFGLTRTYVNLMTTMVLGGLWHGAAWNFVIWGAYQGGLLCLNRFVRWTCETHLPKVGWFLETRIGTVLRWAVTTWFWMLGWLIFRVTDLDDLLHCMHRFVLFDGQLSLGGMGLGRAAPITALSAAGLFAVLHAVGWFGTPWPKRLDDMPPARRLLLLAGLGAALAVAWPASNEAFIYFQF